MLLLHGFPQFWWCWRDQLTALAGAGHRAVAMDLRGYGGSDKTPRGYDPFTLADDVAGVIKALGLDTAVVVGHGWGGYIGWTVATLHPGLVAGLCSVSAPHPRHMLRSLRPGSGVKALSHVLAMQVPMLPERRIADRSSGWLAGHLSDWSAPGSAYPTEEVVAVYQSALDLWPAPHCALEYHRWLFRSRIRGDGRRFNQALRAPVRVPTYAVFGGADPALPDPRRDRSGEHVTGPYTSDVLPGLGHFVPEESPDLFSAKLLAWLATL